MSNHHKKVVIFGYIFLLSALGAALLLRRVQHRAEWPITTTYSGHNWQWVEDAAYG